MREMHISIHSFVYSIIQSLPVRLSLLCRFEKMKFMSKTGAEKFQFQLHFISTTHTSNEINFIRKNCPVKRKNRVKNLTITNEIRKKIIFFLHKRLFARASTACGFQLNCSYKIAIYNQRGKKPTTNKRYIFKNHKILTPLSQKGAR